MTSTIIVAFVAVVVALLIAVPITTKVAVANKVKKDAETVGSAEDKARGIIDEALKTAETKKRETLLEVKEESLRTKNELEKETKERRNELQKYEKRVLSKEEAVDKKADAVEKREAECTARYAELQKKEKRVDELEQKGVQELERVSGLTSEQAKEELLRSVEDDVKVDVARLYKELENRAKEEAGKKAKEYVVNAIQKCAVEIYSNCNHLPKSLINLLSVHYSYYEIMAKLFFLYFSLLFLLFCSLYCLFPQNFLKKLCFSPIRKLYKTSPIHSTYFLLYIYHTNF